MSNSVGAKLKLIRTATGASKSVYARKLDVSTRTLARWEKDQLEVPDDVAGQMYEDLDLILDVIHRQQMDGVLQVISHPDSIPAEFELRGVDVDMWNLCLVYGLLDADINGKGIGAKWAQTE